MIINRHPLAIFLLLLTFVFISELGVMFIIGELQGSKEMNWLEAIVDSTLLTSLCVPFFWYFFVKPLQNALHLESFKAHKIMEMAADGIVSIDTKGRIQTFNFAAQEIFGYSEEEILGENVSILMTQEHGSSHGGHVSRYLKTGQSGVFGKTREFEAVRKDGTVFPMELAISEVQLGDTHLFTGMLRDITEQKLAQERIKHLAHYDALTQLPNRSLFFDRLGQAIMLAKRNRQSVALLFIDLDGFKKVNDKFGHHIGDLLLEQVAERLILRVRESDTLARLGGDEFTLILNDFNGREDLVIVAKDIIESISVPFDLKGIAVKIGVSVGIARYPNEAHTKETLLIMADKAMYSAKAAGKNTYRFGFIGDMTSSFRALDVEE